MLNERGIAIPLTLIALLVLTTLTVGLLALAGVEPQVSRNLADATQARFAAEAGLEWAFAWVASSADWNVTFLNSVTAPAIQVWLMPSDATHAQNWVRTTTPSGPSAIPSLPPGRGGFTVTLRNDTLAADLTITGTAADTSASLDQNGAVVVTSIGSAGQATRVLRGAIKRPWLEFPAALTFPGNEAEANFNGNSFSVDGNNWNINGTPDPGCGSKYGIAVAGDRPANEAVVENALSNVQKDDVTGKPQGAGSGVGNNTIAPDPNLTQSKIKNFVAQLKQLADVTLTSHLPNGLSFNNVGSSCTGTAADKTNATCWGTAQNPKVVYVKGDPDPTSKFTALALSGTTEGHGILIVEDGDLRISGNFAWYGPIIVTGVNVGLGYMGGGNQMVYGAVMVNETGGDAGFYEGWLSGNVNIRYSCKAINAALGNKASLLNWQEVPSP